MSWEPITTAKLGDAGVFWVEALPGDEVSGWYRTGLIAHANPLCIYSEDDSEYWPHENGGWVELWSPYPAPPHDRKPLSENRQEVSPSKDGML